ncbi:MAG: hypothetical protein HRT38_02690 [Alteromonadaceae bacterium]|nr:hypothetical protein [Alteromonadaceae bacterium]
MKQFAFVQHKKVVSVDDYADNTNPSHHLVDVSDMSPPPETGWPLFDGQIVQPYVLDKVQWLKRLLPVWDAVEAALDSPNDSRARKYNKFFEMAPAINLRLPETRTMIIDFTACVNEVNGSMVLPIDTLIDYGTVTEQYQA